MKSAKGLKRTERKGKGKVMERALGPAADTFGQEIAPLGREAGILAVKIGRLLITGLEGTVYGIEQVASWLRDAIAERLKSVSEEHIVAPNPRIAVPATQALVYSIRDEDIRNMFANLLASDMNTQTKPNTHPSFVQIICQMSSNDARVLEKLGYFGGATIFQVRIGTQSMWQDYARHFTYEKEMRMDFQEIEVSLSNLRRLGLLELRRDEFPIRSVDAELADELEERYSNSRKALATLEAARDAKRMSGGEASEVDLWVQKTGVFVTPLGSSFVVACLPE